MTFFLGGIKLATPSLLAPMCGITDRPFRAAARAHGASLVFSEMVAGREYLDGRFEAQTRALGLDGATGVQLAGAEADVLAEAARVAEASGAPIIDINMGCPARKVSNRLAGSGLMRDLDQATAIIGAVRAAVTVPVTVKMRLGWNDEVRNAPELARRAEAEGVAMVAVHGRTRCQFYKGAADWEAVREVRAATRLPLIVNGDIATLANAREALARSGATGVMIGRASLGRPWLPGAIAKLLAGETVGTAIPLGELITVHYEGMLGLYGIELGVRIARKHLVAYADHLGAEARAEFLPTRTATDPAMVLGAIDRAFAGVEIDPGADAQRATSADTESGDALARAA